MPALSWCTAAQPSRRSLCLIAVAGAAVAFAAGASPAGAHGSDALCVADARGCYATVQQAVDAAREGDTIRIGRGTFAGGITIVKSVHITGAGPGATTIKGGGPVVTIGDPDAATQPTVSVSDVTITGGVSHGDGVFAAGGGVLINAGAGSSVGATVTIRRAVIRGNRAEPTRTVPSGAARCPDGECPYAQADGGGIASLGSLTVIDSVIAENQAGGIASDATGAGISSRLGALSLTRTLVERNRAVVTPPNGRFAEGGGVFVDAGELSVRDSVVRDNRADLSSTLPTYGDTGEVIDMNAHAGGIHVSDRVPTTIDSSRLTGNVAIATDPNGQPLALDSALLVLNSPVTMRHTVVSGNRTEGRTASTAEPGPGGSAVELDGGGTVVDTRISDNTSVQRSADGVAGVVGAFAVLNFDGDPHLLVVRDSEIRDNTATAATTTGDATVQGAGIFNDSLLELHGVAVRGNVGKASGPRGRAEGGGVWNGDELSGGPVSLAIDRSTITHNTLTAGRGIAIQGAGLFTSLPVTLTGTRIAGNSPDQCVGC